MIRKGLIALVVLVLVVSAVTVVWAWNALWRPLDNRETTLEVPADATGRWVLTNLHELGLMPSELAGRLYLRFFAEDRHPQLLRLRKLATGLLAGDDVVGLLRHARRGPAAVFGDEFLDFVAGVFR